MSNDDAMEGRADDGAGELLRIAGRQRMGRSPLLEESWRYWTSLRDGDGLPRRENLDPRAMAMTLGHSMILDRTRPGTVRVRLGGRVMNDLMGMEVRGLPVRAFFEIAERERAMHLVEQAFVEPATVELDLVCDSATGPTRGRMIVLPLRDRNGAVTKAITCIDLDRLDASPPHRFSILRERVTAITGGQAAPSRSLSTWFDLKAASSMEMAEVQTPYAAKPSPVPWLRVVK